MAHGKASFLSRTPFFRIVQLVEMEGAYAKKVIVQLRRYASSAREAGRAVLHGSV